MKNFITISLMIFIAFLPEVLLAHPGHGGHEGGYTIIHYFIEPMHAVVTIGCIVAVIAFVRMSRNKSKQ
jgi:hypothetical protein